MDGGDKSPESLYRLLLDRFQCLEASHEKLKEQWEVVLQEQTSSNVSTKTLKEKEVTSDSDDVTSFPGWAGMPASYFLGSPYRSMLEYMGHAVHVSRTGSGEIIYWNCAAEKLFGYKDYKIVGQRVVELLFDEEYHHSTLAIIKRLSTGKSWSGQLPLKKRSCQNFMALVTKSPLYEDGELAGIVTVSSDAAVFNNTNSGNMRTRRDNANEQSKFNRINLKKIQWQQRPQIAAVPQLASSVSNLASKVLLRKHGDVTCDTLRTTRECEEAKVDSHDMKADRPPRALITKPAFSFSIGRSRTEAMSLEKEEPASEFTQPKKKAEKFIRRLHIGAISNLGKVVDENIQQNGSEDNSMRKEAASVICSQRDLMESTSQIWNLNASSQAVDAKAGTFDAAERRHINMLMNPSVTSKSFSGGEFSSACQGCVEVQRPTDKLPRSSLQSDRSEFAANMPNMKLVNLEDSSPRQSSSHKIPGSVESLGGGPGSVSSKGDNDLHMVADSVIQWEDIQLSEEIGQGSFAIVYRGIWNGSDVAVKVYSGISTPRRHCSTPEKRSI